MATTAGLYSPPVQINKNLLHHRLAMTVTPVANMLASFDEHLHSHRCEDEDETLSKTAWVSTTSMTMDTSRPRQSPYKTPRQSLAASIRDRVKLFDEGQVTLVRKQSRELDFNPEQAEFDPAISRKTFERRSSMGPGIPCLEYLRSSSFDVAESTTLRSPPPTGSQSAADSSIPQEQQTSFANVKSSPKMHKKAKMPRRASTGVMPSDSQSQRGKHKGSNGDEKPSKRKKKKKSSKNKSSATSSSCSEAETSALESPRKEKKALKSATKDATKKSPTKSPTKTKSPKKAGKKLAKETSDLPSAPSLEKSSSKHRRRGRKRDKKHGKHKTKSSSSQRQSTKKKWELVLQHHNQSQQAMFGGLHRSVSMTLPECEPLTPQRRMARRASTGRLWEEPKSSHLWEIMATHAVHIRHEEDSTTRSATGHDDEEDVVVKETSRARPAPRRRMVRRHSTGSVSTRSNESDEMLVDFWHAYETDCDSSSVADCSVTSSTASVSPRPRYSRKRAVRFDTNVTVWVFTKEDTPFKCDLELPQSFVPSNGPVSHDSAPRPPVRRRNSNEKETIARSRDSAPSAPSRSGSSNNLGDDAVVDDDNDESVGSWPRLGKQSRQSQERQQKKHKRRVRFAEQLEEVRYYEKDNVPEVVLPQIGIVFCAAATTNSEDYAPRAPRRSNNEAGVLMSSVPDDHAPRAPQRNISSSCLMSSIQDSIQGLRESEDHVREQRETDLMPRLPRRDLSSRSILSDDSTVSIQDSDEDDDITLEELSGDDDEEDKEGYIVSPLRPGYFRGDSLSRFPEQTLGERGDSFASKTSAKKAGSHFLRPSTVRGDSLQSLTSDTSSILSRTSSLGSTQRPHPSVLRPSTIRGDSLQSVTSNEGSIASKASSLGSTHGCPSRSLRPGTIRGNSLTRMASDASVTSSVASSQPGSMRPSGFRGDSFRRNDEENGEGARDIIWEMPSSADYDDDCSEFHSQMRSGGLHQDIIWEGPSGEAETEDNTESLSDDMPIKSSGIPQSELKHMFRIMTQQEDLPIYAKRPGTFRGDSFREVNEQDDTASLEEGGKFKRLKLPWRRGGVKTSHSNDESSSATRPNLFAKMSRKRDKMFRRGSSGV